MFPGFDPLSAKQSINNEVAINALKREIQNILDSYVGWYDPFCELIQNALDSLEERARGDERYIPQLFITIDLKENLLIVTDNGTGLTRDKFEQFLAPCFSFKSGSTRGYKGVGATYLGYGFNFIQICTKSEEYAAVGKMVEARRWLTNPNPSGNPKVTHDSAGPIDSEFEAFDRGVSIAIKFDKSTRPGNLAWLQAKQADQWHKILSVKTGLGAVAAPAHVKTKITVIDTTGARSCHEITKAEYLWPHQIVKKSKSLSELKSKSDELHAKRGPGFTMPSALQNLDCIYEYVEANNLKKWITLDSGEIDIVDKYKPCTYFAYMYSTKVFIGFNETLKIRSGHQILVPGVQIAANNMPQGEVLQIPLKRNIGRQNQVHVVMHVDNCRSDLGRKGFQKEIVEFAQSIARKLIDGPFTRMRKNLRPVTGTRDDLHREQEVANWKKEFEEHEKKNPLIIKNDIYFLPTKRISVTSAPTREQDVIALFNQLLAGGVIRGIQIMATSERFTYDGMYRVVIDLPTENHLYNKETNPLGVVEDYISDASEDFKSVPKILEYKYNLNALIEDMESGTKNSNDIGLVVVWATGNDYQGNYHITSLLDEDNLSDRQYHGVTHIMTNTNTGQREMDLVVLEELVSFLNDQESEIARQKKKYDI